MRITRGPLPPLQYPLQGKDIAPTVAPKPNAHPKGTVSQDRIQIYGQKFIVLGIN